MIQCVDSKRSNNGIGHAIAAGGPGSSIIRGSEYATISTRKESVANESKDVDPAIRKASVHSKPLVAPIVRTPNTRICNAGENGSDASSE
jgi:hypothetical protein